MVRRKKDYVDTNIEYRHLLLPYTNLKWKATKYLMLKQILNILRDEIHKILEDVGVAQNFLNKNPLAHEVTSKIKTWEKTETCLKIGVIFRDTQRKINYKHR